MHALQPFVSNERIHVLQRKRGPTDTRLVGILRQVLRCGLTKRSLPSYAIHYGFADLSDPLFHVAFGFLFIVSSSALTKASMVFDPFVDVPFLAARLRPSIESWCSLRHSSPSFFGAGRPLQRQYSSAQASSSSRSNAIPRSPIVTVRTRGRTSLLKEFLFMPRYAGAMRSRRSRGGNDSVTSKVSRISQRRTTDAKRELSFLRVSQPCGV